MRHVSRRSIERALLGTEDRATVLRSAASPSSVISALSSEFRAEPVGEQTASGQLRLRTPYAIDSRWDDVTADVHGLEGGGTAVKVVWRMRRPYRSFYVLWLVLALAIAVVGTFGSAMAGAWGGVAASPVLYVLGRLHIAWHRWGPFRDLETVVRRAK